MGQQTPRERFIAALERRPLTGTVPTFELVFYLTMEKFGRVHPTHRVFTQWDQMSAVEQRAQIDDVARLYIDIAETYGHSAIFYQHFRSGADTERRVLERIRDLSGDRFFLMKHGDATFGIPDGTQMQSFANRLADEPDELHLQTAGWVEDSLAAAAKMQGLGLLDGYALCADYCLNTGPFLSPAMFSEFVTPYLKKLIDGYRALGFYSIKHTDGNIMPILDQLAQAGPDALHSLDPQAGVDIAQVKKLVGAQMCLIGNVNCGLLETGTDDDVIASARYALRSGMPGYGYIFSTSNCVYTGMALERYDLILSVLQREGVYPEPEVPVLPAAP